MNYYLGIDPGKGGAWAILRQDGRLLYCDKFISWTKVHYVLKENKIKSAAIEKVQSKSGQGVKSVFTFGMNYGGWLCYLECRKISHQLIPPVRWQKMFLGSFPSGESKARSLDFVNRKYPALQLTKSQHGISDAVCLALYALVSDKRLTKE